MSETQSVKTKHRALAVWEAITVGVTAARMSYATRIKLDPDCKRFRVGLALQTGGLGVRSRGSDGQGEGTNHANGVGERERFTFWNGDDGRRHWIQHY